MKHAVQITVLGQNYTIRSEAAPEEVRKVAAFVNAQLEEAAGVAGRGDTLGSAVLALLNMGGMYLRLREEKEEQGEASERLRILLERLDQTFPTLHQA